MSTGANGSAGIICTVLCGCITGHLIAASSTPTTALPLTEDSKSDANNPSQKQKGGQAMPRRRDPSRTTPLPCMTVSNRCHEQGVIAFITPAPSMREAGEPAIGRDVFTACLTARTICIKRLVDGWKTRSTRQWRCAKVMSCS